MIKSIVSGLAILAVLSGCGATIETGLTHLNTSTAKKIGYYQDQVPKLTAAAEALAIGEISPSWQSSLEVLEVDSIVDMADGRLLVGYADVSRDFGFPRYGPWVMVDSASGKELWRIEREKNAANRYQVLLTNPVLLIQHQDAEGKQTNYSAYDVAAGKLLWSQTVRLDHSATVEAETGILVIAEGERRLFAVDLSSGKERWSRPLADANPTLTRASGHLLMVAGDVAAISLLDGSESWRVAGVGPAVAGGVLIDGDDLFAVSQNGTLIRIDPSGKERWRVPVPNDLVSMVTDGEWIIIHHSDGQGVDGLAVYSRTSGKLAWSAPNLRGQLLSNILPVDGSLYFTVKPNDEYKDYLRVVKTANGRRLANELVFDRTTVYGARNAIRLPDRLRGYPDHIVIVSEESVSGHNLGTGKLLWRHQLFTELNYDNIRDGMVGAWKYAMDGNTEGMEILNASLAELDNNLRLSTISNWSARHRLKRTFLNADKTSNAPLQTVSASSSIAARNQTERTFVSGYNMASTHEQRVAVMDVRIATTEMNVAMDQVWATASMLSAISAVQDAIAKAIMEAPGDANRQRLEMQLMLAQAAHARSVQGDYWVRGQLNYAVNSAWGFTLVDLRDGSYFYASTSPDENAYREMSNLVPSGLFAQLPTLTGDGHLIVKGLGLNPQRWRAVEFGPERIVAPSLLAYDLKKMEFKPHNWRYYTGGWGAIDTNGTLISPPGSAGGRPFSEGLSAVLIDGLWGFIDTRGEMVITPRFETVGNFSEGLASAKDPVSKKNGFIDRAGHWVAPPEFITVDSPFSEGLAEVMVKNKTDSGEYQETYSYANRRGKRAFPGEYFCTEAFSDGLALVSENPKCGDENGPFVYIDKTGRKVLSGPYYDAHPFSEGVALVRDGKAGKFALIDTRGHFVAGPSLDLSEASDFMNADGLNLMREGLLYQERDSKGETLPHYVDQNGRTVLTLPKDLKGGKGFHDGLARVCTAKLDCLINGKWGFIDRKGQVVIGLRFNKAWDFSDGLAMVEDERGLRGYINRQGNPVTPITYSKANSFQDKRAAVFVPGKRWYKP